MATSVPNGLIENAPGGKPPKAPLGMSTSSGIWIYGMAGVLNTAGLYHRSHPARADRPFSAVPRTPRGGLGRQLQCPPRLPDGGRRSAEPGPLDSRRRFRSAL